MEQVLAKILTKVHDNVDLFIKVISTFSFHHIYRLKFDCSCGSARYCAVYLLFPSLVIWILLLAVDKHFFKSLVWFVQERVSRHVSVWKGLSRLVLTLCVSLIWPVSVLLDGDWFVRCSEDFHSNKTTQLDENALKTTSWIYGMYVLGLSLLLFITSSIIAFSKDLRLFDMLIEEEDSVETKLKDAMRRKAGRKLNHHVDRGDWRKCYDKGQKIYQWKTREEPRTPETSDDSDSGSDRDTARGWGWSLPSPFHFEELQQRTATKTTDPSQKEGSEIYRWKIPAEATEHKEPQTPEIWDSDRDTALRDWNLSNYVLLGLQQRTATETTEASQKEGSEIYRWKIPAEPTEHKEPQITEIWDVPFSVDPVLLEELQQRTATKTTEASQKIYRRKIPAEPTEHKEPQTPEIWDDSDRGTASTVWNPFASVRFVGQRTATKTTEASQKEGSELHIKL